MASALERAIARHRAALADSKTAEVGDTISFAIGALVLNET